MLGIRQVCVDTEEASRLFLSSLQFLFLFTAVPARKWVKSKLIKWIQIEFSLAGDHFVEEVLEINRNMYVKKKTRKRRWRGKTCREGKWKVRKPRQDLQTSRLMWIIQTQYTHAVPDLLTDRLKHTVSVALCYSRVETDRLIHCWPLNPSALLDPLLGLFMQRCMYISAEKLEYRQNPNVLKYAVQNKETYTMWCMQNIM